MMEEGAENYSPTLEVVADSASHDSFPGVE